jgi:rod shape-determining protein MreD
MVDQQAHGYWVILSSFLIAYVLAVLPVSGIAAWLRPEWLVVVLIYWAIALPQRVGLTTALITGLGMDVLEGAAIGQNMLALALVVLLSRLLYQRLRVFSSAQQALTVFVLAGVHQLVCQWIQTVEGAGARSLWFMLPALTSALLWPLVLVTLRRARRHFEVR